MLKEIVRWRKRQNKDRYFLFALIFNPVYILLQFNVSHFQNERAAMILATTAGVEL
jgi:hypothetical protein